MELAASIGLATVVLGLSLIIQSRILLDSPDRWVVLAKKLWILAYAIAIPIGIILVAIGFICPTLANSYISVGVTLIIVAITLLIQSQVLVSSNASFEKLGQKIRIWAYICAGAGFIGVVIQLVRIILAVS